MPAQATRNKQTRPAAEMLSIEAGLFKKGFRLVAGVDEAGRGPLAGPVVAAAVVFEQDKYPAGIRDSKQLSPKLRDELFLKICEKALGVGVGIVNEQTIDRINILQAAHSAMLKAIASLEKKPDFVLIDGILAPKSSFPQKAVAGGDSKSISIAAASIIAKVSRDRIMMEHNARFPEYGFGEHKGYGTRAHMESLRKFGPCRIHRKSFRPVAEALKSAGSDFRLKKTEKWVNISNV